MTKAFDFHGVMLFLKTQTVVWSICQIPQYSSRICARGSVGHNSFGDGPQKFCWVRETYKVLTNIFLICVGFPGSGKSQAYRMTVQEPLESLAFINHSCGWLHEKEPFQAHTEPWQPSTTSSWGNGHFFDMVQKMQLKENAEWQLCRMCTSTSMQANRSWNP